MDEELVKYLEESIRLDPRNEMCGAMRSAIAEIRRLDVVIKEGQRQSFNEMYGRSNSGMAVPSS